MKILYGTTNPAKVSAMEKCLDGLDIELISLRDMKGKLPGVTEDGAAPLENAVKKARAYYEAFGIPVFSCDSGLYFENIPVLSPGVHVRNIDGKCLTDEEMIDFYGGLARRYGDITAQYRNAVCFIYDENRIFTDDSPELGGARFIITSEPHEKREKGFPLDSLSKRADNGHYYYDDPDPLAETFVPGFRKFFEEALKKIPPEE